MSKAHLLLLLAILTETIGTMALKGTAGFSRLGPVVLVVLGYSASFYFLGLALKTIPVGIAYAIWSGLGIVLITALGYVLYRERLDAAALTGIALIIAGIIVMQVFSKSTHD